MPLPEHRTLFSNHHERGRFAGDHSPGSTLEATAGYRAFLEQFVVEHDIRSVLDAGCGALGFAGAVDWKGARYVGLDIAPEVIAQNRRNFPQFEFIEGDARALSAHPSFEPFDLLIAKDVLQHWSEESILAFLDQPSLRLFEHVLLVNCDDERPRNGDIADGEWRPLNLLAEPFLQADARPVHRFGTKRVIHRGPRLTASALFDRFEWWVISLDRRRDRLAHARAQLARIGAHGARRFQAFDGHRLQLTSQRPDWVRKGAVGCYLSHLAILKQAQARRAPCVIIEDDIVLSDSFLPAFESFVAAVPEDWDVLLLSGRDHCQPPEVLGPHHARLVATWGTSMTILRLPAIDELLEHADALDRPIDDFYIRMMRSLKFYAPANAIVFQEHALGTNIGDHA